MAAASGDATAGRDEADKTTVRSTRTDESALRIGNPLGDDVGDLVAT
jgi:hypothetical protein